MKTEGVSWANSRLSSLVREKGDGSKMVKDTLVRYERV